MVVFKSLVPLRTLHCLFDLCLTFLSYISIYGLKADISILRKFCWRFSPYHRKRKRWNLWWTLWGISTWWMSLWQCMSHLWWLLRWQGWCLWGRGTYFRIRFRSVSWSYWSAIIFQWLTQGLGGEGGWILETHTDQFLSLTCNLQQKKLANKTAFQ